MLYRIKYTVLVMEVHMEEALVVLYLNPVREFYLNKD
jgi:hypothetical protein